jgi:hypothetical protein
MSERDSTARFWIVWLVAAVVFLIILAQRDVSEIRDLQRRVGQLEEQVKQQ